MSLNPSTDKFTIEFGPQFYVPELMTKYDEFLFHKNSPIKNIQAHIHESIQSISIPGMSLNTIAVNDLQNIGFAGNTKTQTPITINRQYMGNAPMNSVIESTTITVTFRNTLINWMYIYELFRNYYNRNTKLKEFFIDITLRDSAEIPMLNFMFEDCFTSGLPGLEFSYNTSFRESKTFDVTFTFNKMNVNFIIPSFNKKNI